MKKTKLVIAGLGLSCGMAMAQATAPTAADTTAPANTTTPANTASGERSWVGLLVAMGCDNGSGSPSASGNSAMTGPDLNGSRGSGMNGTSNDMNGSGATAATQTPVAGGTSADMPQSSAAAGSSGAASAADQNSAATGTATQMAGSMNTATSTDSTMNGWDRAKMAAGTLGASCQIGTSTSSFALRTPDGRLIPFDSASNQKIADQLRDRVSGNSTKIFRVVVKGTSDGNTITLDSMRIYKHR